MKITEEESERKRNYYYAHRLEIIARVRSYAEKHKKEKAAYNQEYRRTHVPWYADPDRKIIPRNYSGTSGPRKGPGNPRWRGGVSEYKNHYLLKKNRLIVLKAANYVCEKCGRIASVTHHRDGGKTNHNCENLMPLCEPCHFKIHTGRKNKKTKSKAKAIADLLMSDTTKWWGWDDILEGLIPGFLNVPVRIQSEIFESYETYMTHARAELDERMKVLLRDGKGMTTHWKIATDSPADQPYITRVLAGQLKRADAINIAP